MPLKKYFLAFTFLLVFVTCASDETIEENVVVNEGTERVINPTGSYVFSHRSRDRSFYYFQPENLQENAPLVFVLHGYNSTAEQIKDWLPMTELARENGFAVVYPQGLNDDSNQTHWNADLTVSDVDDVGFLKNLALHLQKTYSLSRDKTFICGYSNGGFMSYEMAIKSPEIFKAVASVAGTMSLESWNNRSMSQPMPILQISGDLDRIVPVRGISTPYGGWGGAPGMPDIMKFWAELNQSDIEKVEIENQTQITKYINSESGNEVWFYRVENLDHRIPLGGDYDVNASSLIWEFFSKY